MGPFTDWLQLVLDVVLSVIRHSTSPHQVVLQRHGFARALPDDTTILVLLVAL